MLINRWIRIFESLLREELIVKFNLMTLLLFLATALSGYTDMVIYIDVAHFIPADSQFGVEVKGNKWISFFDSNAIGGKAFGGPGDNDYAADGGDPFLVAEPYLVIAFPEDVKAGESTADGKEWVPWARMLLPAGQNSFYWQVSSGKPYKWKPEIITNAVRWNDDAQNDSNKWYWQDNITGNDGGAFPDIATGKNYVRVGVRESDPKTFPHLDVLCFRNDGGIPTANEALASGTSVEPANKISTTWGQIKNSY
tara:strand:+ start:270 stop:1028 length:759 start_codon:yes stop_codon:yes gene_type:complete